MLDDTKHINPNGCGIGLTVSQKYVEKLGGTFTVESEFGKGTKISFTICNHNRLQSTEEVKSKLITSKLELAQVFELLPTILLVSSMNFNNF